MTQASNKTYKFTYNMAFVNILSLFIILLFFLVLYIFYKVGLLSSVINAYLKLEENSSGISTLTSLTIMLLYFFLHELIHGIFYFLNGAKWTNIKFGIALEKGILFTKCGEYISKKNILFSVIAPFIILGIIPLILSLLIGLPTLFCLSLLNIAGCSGDLMMFYFFLHRHPDIKFKELDDSATFVLKTEEDLSKKKFLSVKLEGELKEEPKDKAFLKKYNVSKFSLWLLIALFTLALITEVLTS